MPVFKPTARDLVILSCYASGKTDAEIGKVLGIKRAYAGTLGLRMRARMGAVDRANAVAISYELGILPVPAEQLQGFRPGPVGRSYAVSAGMLAQAHAGIARGESVKSIACRLGVGRSTLYRALAGAR